MCPRRTPAYQDIQTAVPLHDRALKHLRQLPQFLRGERQQIQPHHQPFHRLPRTEYSAERLRFAPDCMTVTPTPLPLWRCGAGEEAFALVAAFPIWKVSFLYNRKTGRWACVIPKAAPLFEKEGINNNFTGKFANTNKETLMDFKLDRDLIFLDLEATTNVIRHDRIIQIAMKMLQRRQEAEELSMLINPGIHLRRYAGTRHHPKDVLINPPSSR